MGFESLVKSRSSQMMFIKIHGWGMTISIIGGLFKLSHYPFADTLLIIGLTSLAIYYFLLSFSGPKIEPDWTLIFPELELGRASKDYRSPADVATISDLKKEIEKLKNEIEKLKTDRQV